MNKEGMVELTTTIGYHGMVCRVLEAFQVELEGQPARDYEFMGVE